VRGRVARRSAVGDPNPLLRVKQKPSRVAHHTDTDSRRHLARRATPLRRATPTRGAIRAARFARRARRRARFGIAPVDARDDDALRDGRRRRRRAV
jgi:hypothetical protein